MPTGWLPPATWAPDANWAPAPVGWAYYRDPFGTPMPPPPGCWIPPFAPAQPSFPPAPSAQPRTLKTAPILIGVGAAVIVAGLVIGLFVFGPLGPSPAATPVSSTPRPSASTPPSESPSTSASIPPQGPELTATQYEYLKQHFTYDGKLLTLDTTASSRPEITGCTKVNTLGKDQFGSWVSYEVGTFVTLGFGKSATATRTWSKEMHACYQSKKQTSLGKMSAGTFSDSPSESWFNTVTKYASIHATLKGSFWRYGNTAVTLSRELDDQTRTSLRALVDAAAKQ
jgi:hypothetical protein